MKRLILIGLLGATIFASTGCVMGRAKNAAIPNQTMTAGAAQATTEEATEAYTEEQTAEVQTTEMQTEAPTEEPAKMANRMFEEADHYYLQDDARCQDVLDEIKLTYPQFADAVEARKEYYIEYGSLCQNKLLFYVEPFDYQYVSGDWFNYNANKTFEDKYGNTYYDFARAIIDQTGAGKKTHYVVYNSDGEYDTFKGTIVCSKENDEEKIFHAEVYGDGELLYATETISCYSEPLTFEVDITGHKLVKIVLIRDDSFLTYANVQPSVALVDAVFYNKVLPEFVPFVPVED